MDNILIFFGMSVVLAMLGMVISALGVSYHRMSKRLNDAKRQQLEKDAQGVQGANRVIEEANLKAQQILVDAQKQAQSMVNAADIFSQEYKEEFRGKLLQVIQKEEVEFKNLYTSIKEESNKALSNISKDINAEVAKEMEAFRSTVQNELQKHIEEYKKASYARIEQDVAAMVDAISRKVLRKAISPEDQKKLIMEALTEAKQNNVF